MQKLLHHGYWKEINMIMIRLNQKVNFLSCEWFYDGKSSKGIKLKSVNKNINSIIVPFNNGKYITKVN